MELLLYSTVGCHLCEDAVSVLEATRAHDATLHWRIVEIANDTELLARYGVRIPVISCDKSPQDLGWPFGPLDVLRYINNVSHSSGKPT